MISDTDFTAIRNGLLMVINDVKAEADNGDINLLEASVQEHLCQATIKMLDMRSLGWRYPDNDETPAL